MTVWHGGMVYGLAGALMLLAGAAATAGDWVNPDGSATEDPEIGDTARVAPRETSPIPLLPPQFGSGDERPRYVKDSIPRGHLPPPGLCRLWYPDRPPGHQPPPDSCAALKGQAVAGAWLIEG